MADEKVRYDYSGQPVRPFSELDSESGEYEGGSTLEVTRDDREAIEIGGQWYITDATGVPKRDQPVDRDQILP